MSKASVMGRAWFFDTGDPTEFEVWEYELEPMGGGKRSGAEWAREHLATCYTDEDLRELLGVPSEGNYQVVFKGTIEGEMSGYYEPEWDEWFELEESKYEVIPPEFLKFFGKDEL